LSDETFRFATCTEVLVQHGGIRGVESASAHGTELDAGTAFGAQVHTGGGTSVGYGDGAGGAPVHAFSAAVAVVVHHRGLRCGGAKGLVGYVTLHRGRSHEAFQRAVVGQREVTCIRGRRWGRFSWCIRLPYACAPKAAAFCKSAASGRPSATGMPGRL